MNLRHSSFNTIGTRWLLFIKYIDIAFTNIVDINLFSCAYLDTVMADVLQRIIAKQNVDVQLVLDISDHINYEKISLGSMMTHHIGNEYIYFEENTINFHTQLDDICLGLC